MQTWLKSGSKGTLLIFVYWMGYWAKTNGEQVYTCRGELLNLDQRTIALSAHPRVYSIQWVEMGLERSLKHVYEDTFECVPEVYAEGIKRWFAMFYNNQTEKFIFFFEKLIQLEGRQQLNFPADIQEGSYSTAFGSGATPTPLIVPVV